MIRRFLTVFLLSALVLSSASVSVLATDTVETVPTAVLEATIEPTEVSAEDIEALIETPAATTEDVAVTDVDAAEPTATPEAIIEYVYLETADPAIWDKPFDDYTPAEGLLLLIFVGGFFAAFVSVVFYKVI